jgi:Ser/Thr protein kinase RdoA (MazF antagonist)
MGGVDEAGAAAAQRAATHYGAARDVALEPLGGGLINQSWTFDGPGGRGVLQRLNPIFAPEVNDDLAAVTAHLAVRGLTTPRLLETRDGARWVDLGEDGVFRAISWIPGSTLPRAGHAAEVRAAAALLGRFHRTLADLDHEFRFRREGVHDTDLHLARLAQLLGTPQDPSLPSEIPALAGEIVQAGARVPLLPALPQRVLHGDPKLDNIRFDERGEEAVCLVDLDTLRRGPLPHDLGDAWRSWCNRAGEDEPEANLDLGFLEAAVQGYAAETRGWITSPEVDALLAGLERISLELAARFCTDAIEDRYFGWDPTRFPSRREHNRVRAAGQFSLHRQVVQHRKPAEAIVHAAFSG